MFKQVIILSILLSLSAVVQSSQHIETRRNILESYMNGSPKELFKVFHFVFEKPYLLNSETALEKYKVFKKNLNFIKEHNAKNLSWTLEVNFFADMTLEQTKSYMGVLQVNGNNINNKNELERLIKGNNYQIFDELVEKSKNIDLPKRKLQSSANYFDLFADKDDNDDPVPPQISRENQIYEAVNHGEFLNPPRNQGSCGSCWAFSALTAIEANINRKNKKTNNVYLSAQEVLDCNKMKYDCYGGWPNEAMKYVAFNGVSAESNYPYKEVKNTSCRTGVPKVEIKFILEAAIKGCAWIIWFEDFKPCTKESYHALVKEGPVSSAIYVDNNFIFYKSGIIDGTKIPNCMYFNHAVVVYGWSHYYENNQIREFLNIRNSWGAGWGDKGDIKYFYDDQGSCFLTKLALLPNLQ